MEPSGDSRVVNLHSLLTSGEFSDLKILCESREFAVHKAILCAQSRVIRAECKGDFEESRQNVIKIEEFNADTVQRMLEYLYSGDYSVSSQAQSRSHSPGIEQDTDLQSHEQYSQPLEDDQPSSLVVISTKDILRWHLHANAIGDYYDIQPLCRLARAKFENEVEENWSADDFLALLRETCTTRRTGDVGFHRLLGHTAAKHLEDLNGLQDLEDLDMPVAIAASLLVLSAKRVRSLEETLEFIQAAQKSLEERDRSAHVW
ncbi:hypothetical protein diail_5464 [Diaporthe ilicicola]|nr:hypothetical protein diail_5464 [Diaporthe ilicicola]